MGRGRKPNPTRLKILRGNPGHRRLNEAEPTLEPRVPDPPADLDDDAKREWMRIATQLGPAHVLTNADWGIVLMACSAYSQYQQCDRYLKERGSLHYKGTNQNGDAVYRPYPEVAQRNQARRQYVSYLAELGMSPSSRSKVKSLPAKTTQGIGKLLGV